MLELPDKNQRVDETQIYSIFREYIKHEDSLINNRMTWMLTIHGFLYATYGFTLQKLLEIYEKSTNEVAQNICNRSFVFAYSSSVALPSIIFQTKFFLMCICIVGFVISGTALYSIGSAYDAVFSIEDIFGSVKPPAPFDVTRKVYLLNFRGMLVRLPLITGGGRVRGAKSGIFAAWSIPTILCIGWVLSFVFICIGFYGQKDFSILKQTCQHQNSHQNYVLPLEGQDI